MNRILLVESQRAEQALEMYGMPWKVVQNPKYWNYEEGH